MDEFTKITLLTDLFGGIDETKRYNHFEILSKDNLIWFWH